MAKYELTDEYVKIRDGTIMYRIRALKDFGDVKKGDLGGYVEKKENLSHVGDCWVYDDAKVYGNAEIYGNAKVFHEAKVYGDAIVDENAEIYGYAKVFDNAEVYSNAELYNYMEMGRTMKTHRDDDGR